MNERILYWVKFQWTDVDLWKIGLCNMRGISDRYPNTRLVKDGLTLATVDTIVLAEDLAIAVEEYVLTTFPYRVDARSVMKACKGGTECFAKDVLKQFDLTLPKLITLVEESYETNQMYLKVR